MVTIWRVKITTSNLGNIKTGFLAPQFSSYDDAYNYMAGINDLHYRNDLDTQLEIIPTYEYKV